MLCDYRKQKSPLSNTTPSVHSSITTSFTASLCSAKTSEDKIGHKLRRQPGCTAIPDGMTEFVVRLTNSDATGMNTRNRVENEVAMINLVGAALNHYNPKVVPSVYGWGSAAAESSQGWILQELMPGVPVDAAFDTMDLQSKKIILAQMAKMLSEMKNHRLPRSITGYGGLTFDSAGRIVSGPITNVDAGPWHSYEDHTRRGSRLPLSG